MRFSLTPLFFDLQAVLRCRTVGGTAHNKTLKGVVLSRLQAALASWGSEGNHYDLKCSQTSGSVYNLNIISGLPPSFVRFKCIVCDPQKSITVCFACEAHSSERRNQEFLLHHWQPQRECFTPRGFQGAAKKRSPQQEAWGGRKWAWQHPEQPSGSASFWDANDQDPASETNEQVPSMSQDTQESGAVGINQGWRAS